MKLLYRIRGLFAILVLVGGVAPGELARPPASSGSPAARPEASTSPGRGLLGDAAAASPERRDANRGGCRLGICHAPLVDSFVVAMQSAPLAAASCESTAHLQSNLQAPGVL